MVGVFGPPLLLLLILPPVPIIHTHTSPTNHNDTHSPVNDLLDRGDFTLTDILDEDDVLQEIKSMNTRLVDLCVQAVLVWGRMD